MDTTKSRALKINKVYAFINPFEREEKAIEEIKKQSAEYNLINLSKHIKENYTIKELLNNKILCKLYFDCLYDMAESEKIYFVSLLFKDFYTI